jgi:hypothetical protein
MREIQGGELLVGHQVFRVVFRVEAFQGDSGKRAACGPKGV